MSEICRCTQATDDRSRLATGEIGRRLNFHLRHEIRSQCYARSSKIHNVRPIKGQDERLTRLPVASRQAFLRVARRKPPQTVGIVKLAVAEANVTRLERELNISSKRVSAMMLNLMGDKEGAAKLMGDVTATGM